MEKLQNSPSLQVRQKKEWGEILTGFETRNKYSISNSSGEEVYFAAEESSFLVRFFLKSLRHYTIHIVSPQGKKELRLKKGFQFYFHEMEILDSNGTKLGEIKKQFAIFSSIYTVLDSMGNEIYKIVGPFFHPWTFNISKNGADIGKISKEWSGTAKEIFTDADNFNIQFPPNTDTKIKSILLGALFLIDMIHFDQK